MRLGLALGWHSLPFEALLEVVRSAEQHGFATVFVDGDVSMLPSRGEGEVLDGLTVTTELLARTERIEVTSIRLVHHWNAARLAQTQATLARLHPGRVRLFVSIGGRPEDRAFGLPCPPARDRVLWLDETLDAVRALWRGETVSRRGRFVSLDRARVRPRPPDGVPVHVAAGGSRALLGVVARHADAWDVNLPPLSGRVTRAAERLAVAARAADRDPRGIERSQWLFTRPGRDPADPTLVKEFRRLNPWFGFLSDDEVRRSVVSGPPGECQRRIRLLARELGLSLPVVDLSGLGPEAAGAAVEALAPGKTFVDPSS